MPGKQSTGPEIAPRLLHREKGAIASFNLQPGLGSPEGIWNRTIRPISPLAYDIG